MSVKAVSNLFPPDTFFYPPSRKSSAYFHDGRQPFVYTSGVRDFCRDHKAYWILGTIGEYVRDFSPFLNLGKGAMRNGKCKNELPLTVHNFILAEDRGAFYSAECEKEAGRESFIFQKIARTSLTVSVRFLLADAVLLFPSEY